MLRYLIGSGQAEGCSAANMSSAQRCRRRHGYGHGLGGEVEGAQPGRVGRPMIACVRSRSWSVERTGTLER